MDRIAFVVPRFGQNMGGGAETECLETAKRLCGRFEVDILTSCAEDYINWTNVFDKGTYRSEGLTIIRFAVENQPDEAFFESIKVKVYGDPEHSQDDELLWAKCRGPFCPSLIEYLKDKGNLYKAVFYASYPWYTSTAGLMLNQNNSVFMPMAHDERQIYLNIFKKVFSCAKAFIYNTETEKKLVESLFHVSDRPNRICGIAVETREVMRDFLPEDVPEQYILYVGRISNSKNISELFKFFIEYKRLHDDSLHLVVAGKQDRDYLIPFHPFIKYMGFVNEEEKHALLKKSIAVIMPSKNESLSITVLEGMAYGRPVIVNGKSHVLKAHCISSNAGLYYNNYFEFEAELDIILHDHKLYNRMSENGVIYIDINYRWSVITDRIVELIKELENG